MICKMTKQGRVIDVFTGKRVSLEDEVLARVTLNLARRDAAAEKGGNCHKAVGNFTTAAKNGGREEIAAAII